MEMKHVFYRVVGVGVFMTGQTIVLMSDMLEGMQTIMLISIPVQGVVCC